MILPRSTHLHLLLPCPRVSIRIVYLFSSGKVPHSLHIFIFSVTFLAPVPIWWCRSIPLFPPLPCGVWDFLPAIVSAVGLWHPGSSSGVAPPLFRFSASHPTSCLLLSSMHNTTDIRCKRDTTNVRQHVCTCLIITILQDTCQPQQRSSAECWRTGLRFHISDWTTLYCLCSHYFFFFRWYKRNIITLTLTRGHCLMFPDLRSWLWVENSEQECRCLEWGARKADEYHFLLSDERMM